MATEASKTKSLWPPSVLELFKGDGIDIGCGIDPIFPNVQRFDQEHGDANRISAYVQRQFDFVFSSHCLEHMRDPLAAITDWYRLVKPGGHLIILVPDEDLYEQGSFPSRFNGDHKFTFTISKTKSWSPRSVSVLELAKHLGGEIVNLELQDFGYDRRLLRFASGRLGNRLSRIFEKYVRAKQLKIWLAPFFCALGATVDQTNFGDVRLAQIQLILKKPA